jgi:hypothetical protein
VAQKDFGDLEEEPMLLSFSFLNNVSSINAISSIENIAKKEFHVDQEQDEEEFAQESRKVISNSNDDSLTYEIIGSNNSCEEFECESLKEDEDLEETQKNLCNREEVLSHGFFECINEKEGSSYHEEYTYNDSFVKNEDSFEKTEERMYEEEFDEMEYDEEDEDEYEWENDEVMEQIKLEMKNARQGGLATILEEGEEDDVERKYSSKVVEEKIKPLSIDEKMEYKDHIVEIQKVYKCYAQKMRKLDVLNYQAMHAIGE